MSRKSAETKGEKDMVSYYLSKEAQRIIAQNAMAENRSASNFLDTFILNAFNGKEKGRDQ